MATPSPWQTALEQTWYVQGFNAVPLFLNHAAWSGFTMHQQLGFGYSRFLYHYQRGYGEMHYLQADFSRLWQVIKEKIAADPPYLASLKQQYDQTFAEHDRLFDTLTLEGLSQQTDAQLFQLLKKCAQAQIDSVGIAHIVDAIGVALEPEFKQHLTDEIGRGGEFNRHYALLTAPTKLSFIAQEDEALRRIAILPAAAQPAALQQHHHDYFWLQNSYAGPVALSLEFFRDRLTYPKPNAQSDVINEKLRLITQLQLSAMLQDEIALIDYVTIWQDERKRNVLRTIGYWGWVLDEISRRTNVPMTSLYYLGVRDLAQLHDLAGLNQLAPMLAQRTAGVWFYMEDHHEIVSDPQSYPRIHKLKQQLTAQQKTTEQEIHGSIANGGRATGRVVVCKDLTALDRVGPDSILVTSMTRPEFIPAMKRAAAIVTDEGGITCHAAIVSRELGKPCVIGTKIATAVLKDGMLVEVKANHGVIKIVTEV